MYKKQRVHVHAVMNVTTAIEGSGDGEHVCMIEGKLIEHPTACEQLCAKETRISRETVRNRQEDWWDRGNTRTAKRTSPEHGSEDFLATTSNKSRSSGLKEILDLG